MKYLFTFLVASILASCSHEENAFYDYMKWDGDTSTVRQYVCMLSDSIEKRVLVKQTIREVGPDCWEFEHYFFRPDSMALSRTIERYYSNNDYELVKSSIFEQGADGKQIELIGEFKSSQRMSLNDSINSFDVHYTMKAHAGRSISIHTQFTHRFITIGTPYLSCLVLDMQDSVRITNLRDKNDTTFLGHNSHTYLKGKGLFSFSESSGPTKEEYFLVNKPFDALFKK